MTFPDLRVIMRMLRVQSYPPTPEPARMVNRLNDLTKAEIAEYKERRLSKREERACAWCDKLHLMRADQHFCCASCRAAYAAAAARLKHEELMRAQEKWHIERGELIREIAALKRELGRD